jgi:RimJ/RimL family protein N-acetyltransferase
MKILRTARLTLEPQVAAHAREMFDVLSDPAIYEYENQPPASLEWLCERFTRLESRRSSDGSEHWLNWVIRLPASGLIGYVQATVAPGGSAAIAYELNSRYWGQGFATEAIRAMVDQLVSEYEVHTLSAVLKQRNQRSLRLLMRLGFAPASPEQYRRAGVEPDELYLLRSAPPYALNAQ